MTTREIKLFRKYAAVLRRIADRIDAKPFTFKRWDRAYSFRASAAAIDSKIATAKAIERHKRKIAG